MNTWFGCGINDKPKDVNCFGCILDSVSVCSIPRLIIEYNPIVREFQQAKNACHV